MFTKNSWMVLLAAALPALSLQIFVDKDVSIFRTTIVNFTMDATDSHNISFYLRDTANPAVATDLHKVIFFDQDFPTDTDFPFFWDTEGTFLLDAYPAECFDTGDCGAGTPLAESNEFTVNPLPPRFRRGAAVARR